MLQAKPIGKASHQASQYAVEAVGSLITSIDIKISVDEQPYSLEQSIEKSIRCPSFVAELELQVVAQAGYQCFDFLRFDEGIIFGQVADQFALFLIL